HRLEREHGSRHGGKSRTSASALQVHEIVYCKIHPYPIGKIFEECKNLLIGRTVFPKFCRFLYLNSRAERDGIGIEYRAFTVGIGLLQLAQCKFKRLKRPAELMRKTDVENIFAALK